jgi:hypothetical protein
MARMHVVPASAKGRRKILIIVPARLTPLLNDARHLIRRAGRNDEVVVLKRNHLPSIIPGLRQLTHPGMTVSLGQYPPLPPITARTVSSGPKSSAPST